MGLDGHPDQGMVLKGAAEVLAELEARGGGAVVGRRKVVKHLAHHRPDAGLGRGPGHVVGKEIHVGEGGGAGQQHLGHRQLGAPIDEIAVEAALGGKDVIIEPFFQGQVVGQAPEQGHGGMGVGIDEAGEDQPLGVIQHPGRGVALLKLRRGPHRDNLGALEGHRPGGEHLVLPVHGQHPGALDDQGNRFFPRLRHPVLL